MLRPYRPARHGAVRALRPSRGYRVESPHERNHAPPGTARCAVIDDNPDILANIHGYLDPLGYNVDSARDGHAGLAAAVSRHYDAIVLDLMLPGLDGLEVCRRLRHEERNDAPIVMLTARDTTDDRVLGLNSGADDYLVKPFSLAELDARLQALARRRRGRVSDAPLRVGALQFDTATYEVSREGRRLELSPMGYQILGALMRASPPSSRARPWSMNYGATTVPPPMRCEPTSMPFASCWTSRSPAPCW
jgi:DNA-binding response OmpR family regulator